MMKHFKPMKPIAITKEDFTKLRFPLVVSPKLDGIRCLIKDGKALTYSLKPIPNDHIRNTIEGQSEHLDGYEGEIIMEGKNFNEISSAVMSKDGEPDFRFIPFDYFKNPEVGFIDRFNINQLLYIPFVYYAYVRLAIDMGDLNSLVNRHLELGYEGSIIRSMRGKYKYGRSTLKEGIIMKYKPFKDSEAEIIGYEEQMTNNNPKEKDNLGNTKRSSHKANKTPNGKLGKLIVRDIYSKVEFKIGTGFTNDLRVSLWETRDDILGNLVKYKYQEVGSLNKPRLPVFLGFRDKRDL